ncbi:MAG TPA: hypothetical protein VFV67_36660 [Actinophytocola sp.]|uniref:hypothetical protein n=1 Tax=Actinophytocola sp. TaxID=1872138 RepID=UPI002DC03288|nr:hypothetical protein [Actinophytocola sp.]HEU5476189.1 hypothetical protein [Actinophytocola sp.]
MSSDPADLPLDELDEAILQQVRDVSDIVDPPPPDLDDRALFAIGLEAMEFEVARLQEDVTAAGARVSANTRAVTFEADSLTIMATISAVGEGHSRIEGWLAPPGPRRVDLRSTGHDGPSRRVFAEPSGRFVFERVPSGVTQFVVRVEPHGLMVVTSLLLL